MYAKHLRNVSMYYMYNSILATTKTWMATENLIRGGDLTVRQC